MRNRVSGFLVLSGLVLAGQSAFGGTTGLYDWCVNLNGDTTTACNYAGSGGPSGTGSIDLSAFDTTLEATSPNNLGTVTVNLGVGNNQYASFYADYDLDYAAYGSFNDSASVNGSLPTGVTYSVNDPNLYNGVTTPSGYTLFDEFANNTLDNTNYQPTPAGPPNECCDVGFALAVSGLDVLPGGSGTVTFTVSDSAPGSGFYIQQTNTTNGDSIYLTETANIVAPVTPPSGTPEPSTFGLALGASMIGGLLYFTRGRRSSVPTR